MACQRVFSMYRSSVSGVSGVAASLAGLLMLVSGATFAQSTANGNVRVNGTIVGGSCSITTPTVDLGRHRLGHFSGIGTFTPWVDVPITSQGCDSSVVTLHMGFNGAADPNNPNLFAVASGGARGIGIEMQTADGSVAVIPNSTTNLVDWTPLPVGGTYAMRARYNQSSASVGPGAANSTVTVVLSYN
jgi:major type 1 subunit fimbrin (pilin)